MCIAKQLNIVLSLKHNLGNQFLCMWIDAIDDDEVSLGVFLYQLVGPFD
jgi:hypothetical protein